MISSRSVSTSVRDECDSVGRELSSVQLGSYSEMDVVTTRNLTRSAGVLSLAHQIRFQGACPLFPAFPKRPSTRHPRTNAAEEHFGVDPLEGLGQDVADIGQVEQE